MGWASAPKQGVSNRVDYRETTVESYKVHTNSERRHNHICRKPLLCGMSETGFSHTQGRQTMAP